MVSQRSHPNKLLILLLGMFVTPLVAQEHGRLATGNDGPLPSSASSTDLTLADWQLIRAMEKQRIDAIEKVIGSVVAIYDADRQGGGSGVIIHPSGIALTNHHVIMGAGIQGWGGLADGQLYPWTLIGTDPGGDVAIIQLEGNEDLPKSDFPWSSIGDSDTVRVGDWALAMGNPFILTEDQKPTVTLGIVSGVKRYQPGAGANQLVYGNCIQVDSSINPGNSGGPLFNLKGEVIGINGRGSFQDRGRVNVGLGYAISSNQIKNFIPDLLATKLVEHGTLDANFSDRGGKVVCSTINRESPIAKAGLDLGDELIRFEGVEIDNANQFTNLICTLPEDWPVHLEVKDKAGERRDLHVRLFGLPYQRPSEPPDQGGDKSPEEEKKRERMFQMFELLSADPGKIRNSKINRFYAQLVLQNWRQQIVESAIDEKMMLRLTDELIVDGQLGGQVDAWYAPDGKFKVVQQMDDDEQTFVFDGKEYWRMGDKPRQLSKVEVKLIPVIVQAMAVMRSSAGVKKDHWKQPFGIFGNALIDGADKAVGETAFRYRAVDDDEDQFYFWMGSKYRGQPIYELVKAAPAKDAANGSDAITFEQWKSLGGWRYSTHRRVVTGLAEKELRGMKNVRAEQLPLNPDLFSVALTRGQSSPKGETQMGKPLTEKPDSGKAPNDGRSSHE